MKKVAIENIKIDENLLSFIKQLELQENIILFEEINIELKEGSDLDKSKGKIPGLAANLKIIVYGKTKLNLNFDI